MNIDFRLFRRALVAVVLSASTMACSAPDAAAVGKATPESIPTVQASSVPAADVSPVAMTVDEKKVGEGAALDGAAAYLVSIELWSDKIGGTPMGKGAADVMLVPSGNQMPGLVKAAQGMKVGGVKEITMTAQELFGQMPANARMNPNRAMYIRMTAKDVFPEEEFKIETVKPGTGEKTAEQGDVLLVDYTGRLDNFKDGKIFDSSKNEGRNPFPVTLGEGQVIPGWEQGLLGAKKGEVRRLSIPHYLAYGPEGKGDIPAKARLFFEVEVKDFIAPGELKQETKKAGSGEAIKSGEKGRFHYTGWLDGFEGKKKFDSSLDRNEPFEVQLGQGMVIKGWDEGLVGMKPGEVRRLTIPYNYGYGEAGSPGGIPPYATLYFEVTYLGPAK